MSEIPELYAVMCERDSTSKWLSNGAIVMEGRPEPFLRLARDRARELAGRYGKTAIVKLEIVEVIGE